MTNILSIEKYYYKILKSDFTKIVCQNFFHSNKQKKILDNQSINDNNVRQYLILNLKLKIQID